jgi:hypothetical protein
MGLSESTIKTLTEPITHLIDICGHSDCKSKCGDNCFEIKIDTHNTISVNDLNSPKLAN